MAGTARRKLASFLQRLGSDGDTIQDDASCASDGEEEDDLSTDGSTTLAELLAAAEGKPVAPLQETANLQRTQGVRKPTFSRLNELEEQVAKLERERVQEAVQHQAQLQQKDRQLLAMQQQLQGELQRMQERQQSLERRAPALRAQLREAKQQLEELPKLEACQYRRLKELPLEARTLKQDVQVVLHEALSELSARVQQQSLELEAAREREQALRRQAEAAGREAARLQRLADATSEDAAAEAAGLRSRVERLQSDLEVATIRSEVLSAKGQMFDDVQAKADKLQEEVERLGAEVAGKSALEEEQRRLREDFRSRDHERQLLAMDKAYLKKETEALRSDVERLSSQLDVQSKKVAELKEARQVLYEKLHVADSSVRTSSEARLESELGRIKKLAEDDLERMRREHAETLDRETSVLREMRAEAQAECRRLQGQLKDLQATYDDLLVSSREAGKRADLRTTELAGELKLKAFELSRVQCVLDEKEAALAQARLQADMLQDKVRVLSDSFYAAEAQHSGRIAELEGQLTASASTLGHYQELERNLDEAILNWSSDQDTREARLLRDLGDAVPTAIRRRVQQSLALAARCSRLEAERQLLAREKEEALSRCAALQGELAVGGQRLMQAQQPHSFLLEELEAAEQRAKRAEASAEALQASLDAKQKELTRAKQVVEEMKADMQQLLSQHASLDSIRRMLSHAAAPAPPRVPPSVPQPDATSPSPVIISGSS